MPSLTLVDRDGVERQLVFQAGDTLMVTAVRNAVLGIEARCGGACACGTCAVEPELEWRAKLAPVGEGEREMLDWTGRDGASVRLSCQIQLTLQHDGLRARVIDNNLD
ncbi:MAG: 2Fe-2S iron-sulfur cluster-binding protein [Hyphomonadaceae bacterium]